MNLSVSIPVLIFAFVGLRMAQPTAPDAQAPLIASMVTETPAREENAELIPWSVRRNVSWEDFQSAPVHGTDAVASTSTSLGLSYQYKDGELSYTITCNFQKSKSWGIMQTDYILAHEQAHFDITELCARRLYQALSGYEFNRRSYKSDLTRIYNGIVREKEAMQETYDRETDHSRNRKVQMAWLDRVNKELDETQAYAVYP
jgi:hypothetical protein